MSNFESKTLKRTFGAVYFGTLVQAGAPAGGSPHAMGAGAGGDPHAGVTSPAATADVGKVEKAAGADGRSISTVWAQRASLAGKSVSIRGVVVKYTAGVMGKNWIHLQDGSGDAGEGTHDITVTTMDGAVRGETITITGTVRTNRDVGAGYSYAVLVEEAKVSRPRKS